MVKKKLGILTGGGDAPGLNAVIRAAVRTADRVYGAEVVGVLDGFSGLIEERFRVLATQFGERAVHLAQEGRLGRMVRLAGDRVDDVDLATAVAKVKLVDPRGALVQTARSLGVAFGDD